MNESLAEDDGELYELSLIELIIWCLLYAFIALGAVLGNSLVIFVTLTRIRARSITTYFIINLAFADLLTGIFAIPFKFQAALFQVWFLPPQLCQIVPYAETVTLSVSVFTLTASAIHEFRTVFFPKHGRLSNNNARSLVFSIWLVAAVVALPHGLFHQVELIEVGENETIAQCRPTYAEDNYWKLYNIYLTIIHYFVPMIILDTAYTMIAIKIWSSTVSMTDEAGRIPKNMSTEMSNRKLMKMLMIVVACFSLCWFPLETYLLLNEVKPDINGWKYINILFFCSHWLAMSNSCLNPIIYGLYNNKYKREFRRVFASLRCKKHEENTGDTHSHKFDTEYSPVIRRSWANPYASVDVVPSYSETFHVVPSCSSEQGDVSPCQTENHRLSAGNRKSLIAMLSTPARL